MTTPHHGTFKPALTLALPLLLAGCCVTPLDEGAAPAPVPAVRAAEPPAPPPAPRRVARPAPEAPAVPALPARRVYYFDFDVDRFKPEDRAALSAFGRALAARPGARVRLEGHADERGTREYNLALGERRANGIRDHFVVNGVGGERIEVVSFGEERLVRRGEDEESHALNRRVEIVVQE